VVFLPILAMIFFMGIYPKPFLSRMEPAVNKFVSQVTEKRVALEPKSPLERAVDTGRTMGGAEGETETDGSAPAEGGGGAGERAPGESRANGDGGGGR